MGCESDWEQILNQVIVETEAAEFDLVTKGTVQCRKKSGSYYTPHDVADHFWLQFFRFHHICDAESFRVFSASAHFVEPSAGSGIFVFTLLRQALKFGLSPKELANIKILVIDINFSALQFISKNLKEIECKLGIVLNNIELMQNDFLKWVQCSALEYPVFIGNPPFVANERGGQWRNLYADFLLSMINCPSKRKSISLILPISVCFSRDYLELRNIIFDSGLSISAASYDNIPDSLFKSGKPESNNTNRANSQRCTILHLGGPNSSIRESSALQRWSANERDLILSKLPEYQSFNHYKLDGQIPRPNNQWILDYLSENENALTTGSLMNRHGQSMYSIGSVARNFIGVRETNSFESTSIQIKTNSLINRYVLLQIFTSSIFYEFWRTLGDGFHVTNDLLEKFPISPLLYSKCIKNIEAAQSMWKYRKKYLKVKLNNGKLVNTYDFSSHAEFSNNII